MSDTNPDPTKIPRANEHLVEAHLRAFGDSWHEDRLPGYAQELSIMGSLRGPVLMDLVKADMHRQLACGNEVSFESYCEKIPEFLEVVFDQCLKAHSQTARKVNGSAEQFQGQVGQPAPQVQGQVRQPAPQVEQANLARGTILPGQVVSCRGQDRRSGRTQEYIGIVRRIERLETVGHVCNVPKGLETDPAAYRIEIFDLAKWQAQHLVASVNARLDLLCDSALGRNLLVALLVSHRLNSPQRHEVHKEEAC